MQRAPRAAPRRRDPGQQHGERARLEGQATDGQNTRVRFELGARGRVGLIPNHAMMPGICGGFMEARASTCTGMLGLRVTGRHALGRLRLRFERTLTRSVHAEVVGAGMMPLTMSVSTIDLRRQLVRRGRPAPWRTCRSESWRRHGKGYSLCWVSKTSPS